MCHRKFRAFPTFSEKPVGVSELFITPHSEFPLLDQFAVSSYCPTSRDHHLSAVASLPTPATVTAPSSSLSQPATDMEFLRGTDFPEGTGVTGG